MASDVTIVIKADGTSAVQGINQVGDSLGTLGGKADEGAKGFASMAAGAVSMAEGLAAGATAALAMIDKVNALGVAALRAHDTLNNLSGGLADTYLAGLSTQTGGLVDQMTLASDASFLLTRGLVSNEAELDKATHLGAELGIAFGDTAAGGIDTMNAALEKVGSKRALYGLGLDVSATMAEFDKLKASMGDDAAWKFAIFDQGGQKVAQLGDQFDKTGTAVDRLKTRISDLGSGIFERVSQGLEGLTEGVQGLAAAYSQLFLKNVEGINPTQTPGFTLDSIGPAGGGLQRNGRNDDSVQAALNLQSAQSVAAYQAEPSYQDKVAAAKVRERSQIIDPMAVAAAADLKQSLEGIGVTEDTIRASAEKTNAAMGGQMSSSQATAISLENQATSVNTITRQARRDYQDTQDGAGVTQDDVRANAPIRAEAARDLMNSLSGAGKTEEDMRRNGEAISASFGGAAKNARDMSIATENAAAAAAKELEARKQMNVSQAFGVKGNNLASDVGSGMDSAIAAGRQGIINQDKGKNAKQQAADLAAYDAQAKTAMDQYMISTGQATQASIKFGDIQTQLAGDLAKGKISVTQYATEIGALEKGLEAGTTSMTALNHQQQAFDLANAPTKTKLNLVHSQRADRADENTDGGTANVKDTSNVDKASKSAADLATNLGAANTNANNLNSAFSKIAGAALTPLAGAAGTLATNTANSNNNIDAMGPKLTNIHTVAAAQMPLAVTAIGTLNTPLDSATQKAQAAQNAIGGIASKLSGMVGQLTISVGFSGGGGGAVNGSGGMRGGT